jgi:hypothetical protein
MAVSGGHLNILKYFKERNYVWDCMTMHYAIADKYYDISQWAIDNNCDKCYCPNCQEYYNNNL